MTTLVKPGDRYSDFLPIYYILYLLLLSIILFDGANTEIDQICGLPNFIFHPSKQLCKAWFEFDRVLLDDNACQAR